MIFDDLKKLKQKFISFSGECFLCIASTANLNNPSIVLGSDRESDGILAGYIILREIDLLPSIIKTFDKEISKYFIDCEVKSGIDLLKASHDLIPLNRRHYFKPNDFTVEAADEWLAQRIPNLKDVKIAIIGAGNIGTKLALRLAERGSTVRLLRRKPLILEPIVASLNSILRGTGCIVACSSILECCAQASIIIGCTPGTPTIEAEAVRVSEAAFLLDIGNGCFSKSAIEESRKKGCLLEVLSPAAGWEGFLRRYLVTRNLQRNTGRRQLENGIWIVSRGTLGESDDVLVDNLENPTKIIGVCNGLGDLAYGTKAVQKIKLVEECLGII